MDWLAAGDESACRACIFLKVPAFQPEQRHFPVQTTGVTGEATVLSNNAVTRNNDGHRIGPDGASHGPKGLWPAERCREIGIGAGFSPGNVLQFLPYGLLERRSRQAQRQVKSELMAQPVGFQLLGGSPHDGRRSGQWRCWPVRRRKRQSAQAA
jgi:hypothetical protein